jgi:hypothetical protein
MAIDYEDLVATADALAPTLKDRVRQIVSVSPEFEGEGEARRGVIVVGVDTGDLSGETRNRIPGVVPALGRDGNPLEGVQIPIVVEPEGPVAAHMYLTTERPCPGGYAMGSLNTRGGTFGGLLWAGDTPYIVSNHHVLLPINAGLAGDVVIQTSLYYGGGPEDSHIGTLKAWIPISFSNSEPNLVDVALAKPLSPHADFVSPAIKVFGVPTGLASATLHSWVYKSASRTQPTRGIVRSTHAHLWVNYGGAYAYFKQQLKYDPIAKAGDSGAFLLDKNIRVVGLHFAGSSAACYGNRIENVIQAFDQNVRTVDRKGCSVTFPATKLSHKPTEKPTE